VYVNVASNKTNCSAKLGNAKSMTADPGKDAIMVRMRRDRLLTLMVLLEWGGVRRAVDPWGEGRSLQPPGARDG